MKRNSRTKKELSFKEKYNLEKERNDKLENKLKVMMQMMEDIQRTNKRLERIISSQSQIKRLERIISVIEPAVAKRMRKNGQQEEYAENQAPKGRK